MFRKAVCPLTPAQAENRGLAWVVGAFVICPCHLPITLGVLGALLAGTAAGAMLRGHIVLAGTAISLAWLAATWHGFRLMRTGEKSRAGARTDVSGGGATQVRNR
jgi:cytochrome c biogenesis protein CcdA